jgi:hypothetical protein
MVSWFQISRTYRQLETDRSMIAYVRSKSTRPRNAIVVRSVESVGLERVCEWDELHVEARATPLVWSVCASSRVKALEFQLLHARP